MSTTASEPVLSRPYAEVVRERNKRPKREPLSIAVPTPRPRKHPKPPAPEARVRQPGEALPPAQSWLGTTYKTGDGDTYHHMRAGSCHKHLKSLTT